MSKNLLGDEQLYSKKQQDFLEEDSCYSKPQSSSKSKVVFMNEKEQISLTLCQLIKQVSKETSGSAEYNRIAENIAVIIVDLLPEITTYLDQGLLPHYEDAKEKIEEEIIKNISEFLDIYDLKINDLNCNDTQQASWIRKKIISFFTILIKRRCIDKYRPANGKNPARKTPISIDQSIDNDPENITVGETLSNQTAEGIEKIIAKETKQIGKKLREYIELDPDDELKNCYVRNRPDVNCKILLKLRYLAGYTLQEIADYFDPKVPLQTIKSRFDRHCLPLIQKKAISLGYTKD